MNITITTAAKQPKEDAENWSFDISELEHVLENTCESGHYEYYGGRLYESKPQTKPFWVLEKEYFEAKDNLERACEEATDLKEALDTGVNSVRIQFEDYTDFVGFINEDGTYNLAPPYEADRIKSIGVNFLTLDVDDDGYTTAFYTMETGDE